MARVNADLNDVVSGVPGLCLRNALFFEPLNESIYISNIANMSRCNISNIAALPKTATTAIITKSATSASIVSSLFHFTIQSSGWRSLVSGTNSSPTNFTSVSQRQALHNPGFSLLDTEQL